MSWGPPENCLKNPPCKFSGTAQRKVCLSYEPLANQVQFFEENTTASAVQSVSFSERPVPTKNSVHIEIVAFTESRPVAFLGHADSAFLYPRLFPSPRRSASRNSCSPASALGPAAFEPSSQAPPLLG